MHSRAALVPYLTFQAVVKSGLSSSRVEVTSTKAAEQTHHHLVYLHP